MTQDTIKDRLRAARALIDQPEKWTQGTMMHDAGGMAVFRTGGPVVARCVRSAIKEACVGFVGLEHWEIMVPLMDSINRHSENVHGLTGWNDAPERTHADVMLAFDRAIEEA